MNDQTRKTIQKSMLTWFREHKPNTPDIRVKIYGSGAGPEKTEPWFDVSWGWCEGSCHLMLTQKDMEAAAKHVAEETGYKGELHGQWRMRNMRVISVHTHCDDCKRKSANVTMLKHKVPRPEGKDGEPPGTRQRPEQDREVGRSELFRRRWLCPKCMVKALTDIKPEDIIVRKKTGRSPN
jgi:hypothetical protein